MQHRVQAHNGLLNRLEVLQILSHLGQENGWRKRQVQLVEAIGLADQPQWQTELTGEPLHLLVCRILGSEKTAGNLEHMVFAELFSTEIRVERIQLVKVGFKQVADKRAQRTALQVSLVERLIAFSMMIFPRNR